MQRDVRAFLWDVHEAALAIQSFTAGMDAAAFSANDMARSAVERKFEIIGEALNQLAKIDSALANRIPDLPQIVAFRNHLIHGYATVNEGTVWHVVQQSLPPMVVATQDLLDELGSP